MTTAKIIQNLETSAFDKVLENRELVKNFIKTMLIKHPEEVVCNTITNSEEFQLIRGIIERSQNTKFHLYKLEDSDFFIDYYLHQGDL